MSNRFLTSGTTVVGFVTGQPFPAFRSKDPPAQRSRQTDSRPCKTRISPHNIRGPLSKLTVADLVLMVASSFSRFT